jgi:hypothetical protein
MRADQIVAHHNATLNGFAAGKHWVFVLASQGVL